MNHVITKTDDDKSRLQKVKTSDGFELSFRLVDGIPLPDFPGVVDAVREFKSNFQVREDDVWIVAYPNSGTHWLWEVTSMITRDKAERISEIKEIAMVEIQSKFKWAMNGLPSRRVLNTHVYPTHFNQSALKQNKFIVIVRNPKDVAVSRYNMIRGILRSQYEGNFEGFLDLFLEDKLPFGGWYTHLHAWWTVAQQMKDRFLFITYEDCKKDLTSNVRRITEFIGLKKDDSFYEDVATLCGFQRMKEEKILDETEKQKWKENACGFYRKGMVGAWKNWFTVSQNEALDAKLDRELIEPDLRAMVHYEI